METERRQPGRQYTDATSRQAKEQESVVDVEKNVCRVRTAEWSWW